MKYTLVLFLFSITFNLSIWAQPPNAKAAADAGLTLEEYEPVPFAKTITAAQLRQHLTILASDDFEGREAGTEGNDKAAEYIAGQFQTFGLPPVVEGSYFQKVAFNWSQWEAIDLKVDGKTYRHGVDFVSFSTRSSSLLKEGVKEILFLGYGIEEESYNDYKGVDVKDKILLVYKDEPFNRKGVSRITGTKEYSEWSTNWEKKAEAAYRNGAKAILVIENEMQKFAGKNRNEWFGRQVVLGQSKAPEDHYANTIYISSTIAKKLLGNTFGKVVKARKKMQRKGKSKSILLSVNLDLTQQKGARLLDGRNVLGFIEGSDEQLKKEIVVITAHYDHLGKRGDAIYNGADDNGSGTSTVLGVAEAFSKAKKAGNGPRRSVLCMLVTAEEKGLLGSEYYTARPIYPLENTVVNINVDMVGRVDKKYEENPNYIYVIGSDRLSTELHEINEEANSTYTQLTLDYTYNEPDDPNRYYYRSDHYNFAEKGIPAVFYFNGTHEDYHRSSDTVEKINFEKMETIGRLVFHTAWELANRDKRIEVDVK